MPSLEAPEFDSQFLAPVVDVGFAIANGAHGLDVSSLPVEQIEHDVQRSIAELRALLWHALDGPRDAPIVALSITRRRRAEYPVPEVVDRSTLFPGIVLRTAREGWRVGASCPVPEWRDGWAGYAELGAVAWHAIPDLNAPIDADTWIAMERTLRQGCLAKQSAHRALAATRALVRKMLVQTGRHYLTRAPDDRTLCALKITGRDSARHSVRQCCVHDCAGISAPVRRSRHPFVWVVLVS